MALGIAVFFSLISSVQARDTLSVDRDMVIQENFLGINAVHHGFSYLPESREMGMTDSLRALELARVKAAGIRIARTMYRPDWAMGDGPWLRPDWNSVKMKALYAWLADMQRIGVDVALNMGWWFPRDVIWNRDQHLATYPADRDSYCQWVSESIHQIVQVRGFTNVKYIFMFTEPSDGYGDTPHAKKVWDYYKDVLLAANRRLVDDGRRHLVKIIGPNTSQAPLWLDETTRELNDVVDIYASHTYNLTTYQAWYEVALQVKSAVAKTGKPFWIDEYGVQDIGLRQSGRYGTLLAEANAAFINAGAQTSMIWLLSDQYYPAPIKYITNGDSFLDGKHSWGLFPWLAESSATRPAWDAFVLMSRLLGESGGKVALTKGLVEMPVVAIERDGGGLRVMVVNGGQGRREFAVSLSRPVVAPLHRYVYSPEGAPRIRIGKAELLEEAGAQSIQDTLDSGEVAIYSTDKVEIDGLGSDQGGAGEESKNLAFRKPVEASSVDPDWPAADLTDGRRLTSWRSSGGKRGHGEHVTVDLGQVYTIRLVEIAPGYDGATSIVNSIGDVSVTLSENGKRWHRVSIKASTEEVGAVMIASFPPRNARFVRVTVKANRQSASDQIYRALLGEVKVFGRELVTSRFSSSPPSTPPVTRWP
ncbi:MAG: discoidin domain-containing protein [Proteobacteria bacterium]|nr:discoidin domain-containing protein [Pseudomonadota bacterium]